MKKLITIGFTLLVSLCFGQGKYFEFTLCDNLAAQFNQLQISIVAGSDTLIMPAQNGKYLYPFNCYYNSEIELNDSLKLEIIIRDGKYEYSFPVKYKEFKNGLRNVCLSQAKREKDYVQWSYCGTGSTCTASLTPRRKMNPKFKLYPVNHPR